jgi:hypothetical protein
MKTPSIQSFLPAAFLLALSGWSGLFYLIFYTRPYLWPRWLFFFFVVLAITGIMLPLVAFLNRRFPTDPVAGRKVIVRESSLTGVYIATLAWLQLGRVLSLGLGLILAGGFILVEFLIRLREKGAWDPGSDR